MKPPVYLILLPLALVACGERQPVPPEADPPPPATGTQADPAPPAQPVQPVQPVQDDIAGSCDADAVQWAVGQLGDDALLSRARDEAGARTARFLRPGEAVTLEYLDSRLNLELDESETVVAVRCG